MTVSACFDPVSLFSECKNAQHRHVLAKRRVDLSYDLVHSVLNTQHAPSAEYNERSIDLVLGPVARLQGAFNYSTGTRNETVRAALHENNFFALLNLRKKIDSSGGGGEALDRVVRGTEARACSRRAGALRAPLGNTEAPRFARLGEARKALFLVSVSAREARRSVLPRGGRSPPTSGTRSMSVRPLRPSSGDESY